MRFFRQYISLIVLLLIPVAMIAQDDDMISIEKLSVNTKQFSEITPVLLPDGIAFCSDRRTSGFVNNETFDNDRVYNIFYAIKEDSLEWGRAKIFSNDLKSMFNQGPFCFSPDGDRVYFTSDVEQGKNALKKGFENRSGIFISEKTSGGWSEPKPFRHNDPFWNLGHPFISPDGKFLYFSADLPGGSGGSDLYVSELINGEWSVPENLGPEVNSPASELYPFFSNTGELFFASDRSGGHGGLDLYSVRKLTDSWTDPVLLPEPINSAADDFSLFREQNGSTGYFASNREKTDDIYMYSSNIIRMSNCDSLIYDSYCYAFSEPKAAKIDSMPFSYEWDFDDGTTATGVEAEHCFQEPGTYLVKLNVIDEVTGEIQYADATYLLEVERTVQPFIDSPDTCDAGQTINLDASDTYLPGWDIEKYYWNFDDGTIDTGISVEKMFMRSGIYDIQLIVSSYPDEDGNIRQKCVSKYITVEER